MDEKEKIRAADRFLKTGETSGFSDAEIASFCDIAVREATKKSIRDALKIAELMKSRCENTASPLELSACRNHGRLNHMAGNHEAARESYTQARSLCRGKPLIRARIDRALIDVNMYLGDLKSAKKAANAAIRTFRLSDASRDLAQTQVNYAHLLHRQDRHKDAEAIYRQALGFFEETDDRLSSARCYYNLANVLTQQFEIDEAADLYRRSEMIYSDEGFDLDANDAKYGLAWLKMLSGELHVALTELNECEEVYRKGGDKRGEALCTLDRAEVFLSLNMYTESQHAAKASEKKFKSLGLRYETAKASFFRAQAALALGNIGESKSAGERAMTGFVAEKNRGFQAAVKLLQSRFSNGDQARQLRELRSAREMFSKCQLPLWQAVCDVVITSDKASRRSALERLASNRAAHVVPHIYAGWQTALGDHYLDRGDEGAAVKAWRKAADRLDFVRSQLPPVELRTEFGKAGTAPHRRLIDATLKQDPKTSAAWSERYKTAGLWMPISGSKVQSDTRNEIYNSLERLARQIISLTTVINDGGERNVRSAFANRKARSLQRTIRDELARLETSGQSHPDSIELLKERLRDVSRHRHILQFHLGDKDIVVFIHFKGKTRSVVIDGGICRLSETKRQWRFLLESELMADRLPRNSNDRMERKFFSGLGDWLWKRLDIPENAKQILILPEGELFNLPWQAIVADGRHLGDRHDFIVAPSVRHYVAAKQVRSNSKMFEVFRGMADDLPAVDGEIRDLSGRIDKTLTVHSLAKRDDWSNGSSARVWHYAGHAYLRADNPFYSQLNMVDGPIFAADFRLKSNRINLVTLAACRTGEQVAVPGEETTGFVRSFLEMGARNVIASHWPVSDKTTALWMKTFYRDYINGKPILESMRSAAEIVRESYPSAYHWAAFSVFGAGN